MQMNTEKSKEGDLPNLVRYKASHDDAGQAFWHHLLRSYGGLTVGYSGLNLQRSTTVN